MDGGSLFIEICTQYCQHTYMPGCNKLSVYQGFNVLAYTLYVQMSFLKIKLGCYNA